jgi:surface antigen
MQADGNLVAYTRAGQAVWATGTAGHPGAWTALQDDCNLVVYTGPYPATNAALWASGTAAGCGSASGPPAPVDDYPYKTASTSNPDPWNFYFRQATSFAAWRIRTRTGATTFTNQYAGLSRWGNAAEWNDAAQTPAAQSAGVTLQAQPATGRIAQWEAGYHGANTTGGHVAYVANVYPDGSILVEEYNYSVALGYDSRRIYPGSNRWPSVFIQFSSPSDSADRDRG